MRQFDITQKEKNTLYRVQLTIVNAQDMTKDVLRELVKELGYPIKTEGYRSHVVNDYINYWWDYVGQWGWEQKDIRSNVAKKITEDLLANLSDDIKNAVYPDQDLIFTKSLRERDTENLTFWAEVKHGTGKNSLWPSIVQLNTFGDISSATTPVDGDDLRIGYAFKREVQ